MEIKQITPEQVALLKKPLPNDAVTQHPTKTFLSSIKAIYVVERLNDVFGIGSWSLKSEIIDNKSSMIVVKSILNIPSYAIELESYGGNNNGGENSKNFDLGDAYKGACTDALTKICSFLEIGIDVFKGKHTHKGVVAKPAYVASKAEAPKQPTPTDNSKVIAAFSKFEYLSVVLPALKTLRDSKAEWKDVPLSADINSFANNTPVELQRAIHTSLTTK